MDEFEADWTQELGSSWTSALEASAPPLQEQVAGEGGECDGAPDPMTPLRRTPLVLPASSEKFAEPVPWLDLHSQGVLGNPNVCECAV